MLRVKVLEKPMSLAEIEEYIAGHQAYRLLTKAEVMSMPITGQLIPVRRQGNRIRCLYTGEGKVVDLNKSIKVDVYLTYRESYLQAIKDSKEELADPLLRERIKNVLKVLEMRNINMGL